MLSKEIDVSLFDVKETEEHIRFTIKEAIVLKQLHGFMQHLFSFYDKSYQEDFVFALTETESKQSLAEIVELAKEKKFFAFSSITASMQMLK